MNWYQLSLKRLKKQIVNEVSLYHIDLCEITKPEYDFLLSFLDDEELNRAYRMIEPVSERFVFCRSVCKKILSWHLGIDIEKIKFNYERNGKPYIKNERGLHFNVSHSKDVAILGIHHSPIGVDVEFIDDKCDVCSLMDFFMHEHEKQWAEKENTLHRFFSIWTLKEAILKKSGTGISESKFPPIEIEGDDSFFSDAGRLYCSIIDNNKYVLAICI
jgi:4'-phosphopantetheinyl transferase